MADNIRVKVKMAELGVTLYDLVDKLEESGVLPADGGHSNYVTLSYAISGKRSGKRYVGILTDCLKILDEVQH